MTSNISVELGFVEKRAPWKLRSKFFPSKVGGRPAWLGLTNLPNRSDMICNNCKDPLQFLMQVYAPIPSIESAFHRTLFLFFCAKGSCNQKHDNHNFVVFRSQLPRKNEVYSFEPPEYTEKTSLDPSAEKYQPLCYVCGCSAKLKCPKCSKADYCCDTHLNSDWKLNHQFTCEANNQDGLAKRKKQTNNTLLAEFELVTETEELPPEAPEKSDEEKMKEFTQFMSSVNAPKEMQDLPLDDLDDVMKKKDKAFNKFQKRVKLEPEQVLRYHRGEAPLWVSSESIPDSKDIPNCICGSKRIFEFQVMPQLLNHLSLDNVQDSIDWGTLAVYTCSQSCEQGIHGYVKEFLWKQDFSDDHQQ